VIVIIHNIDGKSNMNPLASRQPGQLGMVSIKDLPQVRGGRIESNINFSAIQSQLHRMLPQNMSEEEKR
jgi:hypothetical protein